MGRGPYDAVKSYDMGPPALLHIRRKMCCGFLSPLKIKSIALAEFEHATYVYNSKHTNHYATKATREQLRKLFNDVVLLGHDLCTLLGIYQRFGETYCPQITN
jgi:hypothetical protein